MDQKTVNIAFKTGAKIGYPENWDIIAYLVKTLAGWCCENCTHSDDAAAGRVLTVHHLDGIKMHCSWQNLVALCQRCHLSIQANFDPQQMDLFGYYPKWQRRRGLCPDRGQGVLAAMIRAIRIDQMAQNYGAHCSGIDNPYYEFYCSGPTDLVTLMTAVQERML